MKDTHLLPYILPNVFAISAAISPSQFANLVLPSLKPLFVVKEPPQNMMTLLDNLTMLQSKTDKNVFRERKSSCFSYLRFMLDMLLPFVEVLPLVYNALESDHAVVSFPFLASVAYWAKCLEKVQERALKAVPGLCESIDYAEVQGVLFPRVAVRV
jgi:SCY1-like protein 2